MRTINLTRVVNEKDGTFMYVDEDFDNGITLRYTEDKECVYVQVRRTVGDKPYSDKQISDINKYLRGKGFVRGAYNVVGRFFSPFVKDKFKYLGRDIEDIADVIYNKDDIERLSIYIQRSDEYTDWGEDVHINDYDVVRDFCDYFYGGDYGKDIEIEEDTIKRACMSISSYLWNSFADDCGYEEYWSPCDVELFVQFKDNDKIRETYTLLEDIATRNIDNIELGREKEAEFIQLIGGVER